jgi:hypothetical protein
MDLTGDAPVSTVVSVNTFNDALASVLPPPGRVADVRENEGIATPIERVTDACRVPPAGAALGGELDAQTRLLLQERSKMIDALQGCVKCLKAHQELRFTRSWGGRSPDRPVSQRQARRDCADLYRNTSLL